MGIKINYNVICIGAGGSGGNFIKEFARYIANLSNPDITVSLSLIDGDKVEEKNCSRQPFSDDDVAQNKAVLLIEAIQDVFGLENVFAYPDYINTTEELSIISNQHKKADENNLDSRDIIILIGGVDNHRARQVMNGFFYEQPNIIYIDSANEYSVGEVCIGARINGTLIAPPRSYYFPDVLTDTSPSASEISCGAMNVSAPQHLATNLMAAHLVLSAVVNIISSGKLDCGIIYFDAFKYFSRFERFKNMQPGKKTVRKGVIDGEKAKSKRNNKDTSIN